MFRSRSLHAVGQLSRTPMRLMSDFANISVLNSLTGELQSLKMRDRSKTNVVVSAGQNGFIAPECPSLTYYICGPTVYDAAHIGHARTYVSLDIISRVLRDYHNIPIYSTIGVTDIDDKIIARAKERGVHWQALAREFEASFFDDQAFLGVDVPSSRLRVTEHIPEIQAYVQSIVDNGLAYIMDGSVYFDTTAFKNKGFVYGKQKVKDPYSKDCIDTSEEFSGVDVDTGSSIVSGKSLGGKRNSSDFAQWKASKTEDEPGWKSPWGSRGRPGWHIECSAMTAAALGSGIDIHAGGVDLRFPHHCNEIAQGEACFGYGQHESQASIKDVDVSGEWCSLWMHTGHQHIEGRKMSKSLKNFITIAELRAQGFTADEFRMLCCVNHYRSTVDYSQDKVLQSKHQIKSILNTKELLSYTKQQQGQSGSCDGTVKLGDEDKELMLEFQRIQMAVRYALSSDFNIPHAIQHQSILQGSISRRVKLAQTGGPMVNLGVLEDIYSFVLRMYRILGFQFAKEDKPAGIVAGEDMSMVGATHVASQRAQIKKAGLEQKLKKTVAKDVERVLIALESDEAVSADDIALLRAQLAVRATVSNSLMSISDSVRDEMLPSVGYVLKDLGGDEFFVRPLEEHEK